MAKDYQRTDRIADMLQRELAVMIQREVKDPRIGMVTVSEVRVSRDLAHAKVYISTIEDDKIQDTVIILNKAAGFFRSRLAKVVKLRIIPQLKFIHDSSYQDGNRISNLIDEAIAQDQVHQDHDKDKE